MTALKTICAPLSAVGISQLVGIVSSRETFAFILVVSYEFFFPAVLMGFDLSVTSLSSLMIKLSAMWVMESDAFFEHSVLHSWQKSKKQVLCNPPERRAFMVSPLVVLTLNPLVFFKSTVVSVTLWMRLPDPVEEVWWEELFSVLKHLVVPLHVEVLDVVFSPVLMNTRLVRRASASPISDRSVDVPVQRAGMLKIKSIIILGIGIACSKKVEW